MTIRRLESDEVTQDAARGPRPTNRLNRLAREAGFSGFDRLPVELRVTLYAPTAQDARKSVLWAIGLIGAFYLMTLVLGFGAAALLDTREDSKAAATSEYQGRTFYFCAPGCKRRFDAEPQRYLPAEDQA